MAGPTIDMQVRSDRVAEAIRYVDQLDKAERKMMANATGLGKATASAGKKGSDNLQNMARSALGVVGALTGVASVTGVIGMALSKAKADFEAIKQMQKGAAQSQKTMGEAVGQFVSNNPQLATKDVKTWTQFAQDQGTILGKEGPQRVMQAATALRSGTPGASDEMQMKALERAVIQARISPETDIGSFAKGIVKIQQATGGDTQQASNLLAMMGARAGGDIAGLTGQIGKLKGAGTAGNAGLADVLALFAFETGELDDPTGQNTTTAVTNVMARMRTRNIKLNGKKLEKRGDNSVDMLLNALDDIQAGKYGEGAEAQAKARAQLATSVMKGAGGITAIESLVAGRSRFDETRKMLRDAEAGKVDLQMRQLGIKQAVMPTTVQEEAMKSGQGTLENVRQVGRGGGWDRAREDVGTLKETLGMSGVWDMTGGIRNWAAMQGGGQAEDFQKKERERWIWKAMQKEMGLQVVSGEGAETDYGQEQNARVLAMSKARQAATSEEDLLRSGLMGGGVSEAGGISGLEYLMLKAGGASSEQISAVDRLDKQGMKEAFKEALEELVNSLQEAVKSGTKEGAKAGVQEGAENGPSGPIDAGKTMDSA